MHAGPNIVREGLVFGYDTGANPSSNFDHRVTSRRYFKGKNTTNLQASGVAFGHNSGNYGNVVTVADAPEKGTGWKKVTISNRGSNFRIIQWTYTSMSANLEYWHSAVFDWGNMREKGYFINHDGNGTGQRYFYKPGGYDTNLGSSISINSSLEDGRIISKMIHTAAHTHAFFINNNTYNVSGLNDYFYYKEYQVEQSAYATPYVAGTRSASGSLIDLTKSTTIDVSNVSFGSDGLPTFDGTDDYINITNASQTLFDNDESHSFSLWLKKAGSNSGNYAYVYDRYGTYRCPGLLFSLNTNTLVVEWRNSTNTSWVFNSSGLNVETGVWNFVTVTIDAPGAGNTKTIKVYLYKSTGLETATMTSATDWNAGTDGYFHIGRSISNGTYFNGDVAQVSTYNRALTAQEVQQNYKAYKNRFNI